MQVPRKENLRLIFLRFSTLFPFLSDDAGKAHLFLITNNKHYTIQRHKSPVKIYEFLVVSLSDNRSCSLQTEKISRMVSSADCPFSILTAI